ncbi:polyprenyl synthetase family protein, partial [Kitasatospora purpeofusca]|uniref:polyprenyl synthetase family protein n=1 Tax=Kitasatospora purpeofusca TaxID=67352 RepID=UPI0036CE0484
MRLAPLHHRRGVLSARRRPRALPAADRRDRAPPHRLHDHRRHRGRLRPAPRPHTVHTLFGTPAAINAGTLACLAFDPLFQQDPQSDAATTLRVYRLYLQGLRTAHAGQALDLAGHRTAFEHAVTSAAPQCLLDQVRTAHHLKTGSPARSVAEAAAVLAGADEQQIAALGHYFEAVGTAYQISDDAADLDGVTSAAGRDRGRTAKVAAEDLINGEVTYPVARAPGLLDHGGRRRPAAHPKRAPPPGPRRGGAPQLTRPAPPRAGPR